MSTTLTLNPGQMSLADLRAVWQQPVTVALNGEARAAIDASAAAIHAIVAKGDAAYGINTGFGPLSGFRVSDADLAQHQINLLHHLTVGQGALFSPAETRAIMLTRANALARGYSGIREELIELLLAALNRGVLPEIPSEGSVGASGDLGRAGRANIGNRLLARFDAVVLDYQRGLIILEPNE